MPWTDAQVRLFAAAAHDPRLAAEKKLRPQQARELLMEAPPAQRSAAMKQKERVRQLRGPK